MIGSMGGMFWRAAVVYNKKPDRSEIVTQTEYKKDMEMVSDEIDECNDDIKKLDRKVRTQELKFYAIDKKLDILIYGVNIIKENCPQCKMQEKELKK